MAVFAFQLPDLTVIMLVSSLDSHNDCELFGPRFSPNRRSLSGSKLFYNMVIFLEEKTVSNISYVGCINIVDHC